MRIALFGDIVGSAGRELLIERLPQLRKNWKCDFVLVDADNASGGFGLQPQHAELLLEAGADVITCGDHVWDQKALQPLLEQNPRLLRPMNYPLGTPGRGHVEHVLPDGRKVLVMHPLGQVFIKDNLNCPFQAVDQLLKGYRLGVTVSAILVDFHAEATSEKMAMGQYLDGRVSAVVGSHTHVPTDDACILPNGTAYQTDMGMCGIYQPSVIGFEPDAPLEQFTRKFRKVRLAPQKNGVASLRGLFVETDDRTGLAKQVKLIRIQPASTLEALTE